MIWVGAHTDRDKTQLGWILMMRSLNWISAKSWMSAQHKWEIWLRSHEGIWSHESRSTYSLGFVFILWCFYEYISVNIFIWDTMNYFFIVKVVASSQQVKCSISSWSSLPYDFTVNTHCHVTMGRWCCLGNYVMSQWVGDIVIDTKQSCDQQPGSFTKRSRFSWIFYTRARW